MIFEDTNARSKFPKGAMIRIKAHSHFHAEFWKPVDIRPLGKFLSWSNSIEVICALFPMMSS